MGSRIFRAHRESPRSNLYVMMLSGAIWTPISTAMGIYWQIYLTRLGASPFNIAIIAMCSTFVLSFARIFGGYLTDVIGRRKLIVLMTYLVSMCYLAMFFASTWRTILLASVFLNMFLLYQPASEAIIADSTSDDSRGKNYAILNLVPSTLILFSPFMAYAAVSRYGIIGGTRVLILLTAIAGFIVGILRTLKLRETIRRQDGIELESHSFFGQYRYAFRVIEERMKPLFVFIILLGIVGGLTMMTQLYVIVYLGENYSVWATVRFIYLLTFVVLIVPAGVATDRFGRKKLITIATTFSVFSTVFLLVAPIGHTRMFLIVYAILGSASWAMMSCSIPSLEADMLPKNVRGKAYAILASASSIALGISQLLCGYIYENYGERTPYILSIVLLGAMIIISLKIWDERYYRRDSCDVEQYDPKV